MYPYIHSQHVPHHIWTSSTLFRYLLQSFQRCGSFFPDFARPHFIIIIIIIIVVVVVVVVIIIIIVIAIVIIIIIIIIVIVIIIIYLASLLRGGLKRSLQEVGGKCSRKIDIISLRRLSSPPKNPLSLCDGERHLALSEFFPRFLQIVLRVRWEAGWPHG